MANAEQIKSLIKSHYNKEFDRFSTVALQIAASEARKGHSNLAHEIKIIVDNSKKKKSIRFISPKKDLSDLIYHDNSKIYEFPQLIVSDEIKKRLNRVIKEYLQKHKLEKHGLSHRRKVLLTGPPGTGKTMTASVLSNELKLPFYVILIDKIVTKYMGETSAKLRQIFDFISENQGVYLFDEFDAIGTERTRDNEVGEMRRVLNAFLQFLEQDESNSFIVAATNNITLLDQALFRRFDDVLFYKIPSDNEIIQLIKNKIANFNYGFKVENLPIKEIRGLSHSEITQACEDAIKECILLDSKKMTRSILLEMLKHRKAIYAR